MSSRFSGGAVVGQPEADAAGVAVLKKGGNAVDAAVVTAFLGAVVAPASNGIGGYGGWLMVYKDGEVHCVDFNTRAPKAANPKMFDVVRSDGRFGSSVRERANEIGWRAISVPGVLAGLALALERFGTLSLADALDPAIKAADKGFRVSASLAASVAGHEKSIRAFPETARHLLVGGELPTTKDRLKNADLAKVLAQVADKGVDDFYKGRIAERIVKYTEENGGLVSLDDLSAYEAKLVKPVRGTCGGYDIYAPPLCSSGPSLVQMCRIAENARLDLWARDAPRFAHGVVETLRAAWMDRYRHFGDPEATPVPMDMLLSDVSLGAAAHEVSELVSAGKRGQCLLRPLYGGGTTHISAVDEARTMASLTLTHGPAFGSFVTIPRTGLLMNSGMSRFDPGPGLRNSVGPGKRPVVNMAPALVLKAGKPAMALGASGGTRIPSSLFQVMARRFVLGEDLEWAMSAGRVHSEGNEWVRIEPEFGEMAPAYLKGIGYEVRKGPAAANVRAIEVTGDNDLLAIYDPRMKAREKGH